MTLVVPDARPTNAILIEFGLRQKFAVLLFKMCSTDHNEILQTSRQCNCKQKFIVISGAYFKEGTPNFDRISNSIEIPLVGRTPGHNIS